MAFSLTNTASTFSTTNASSYTFSAQSFGAEPGAGETRHVIIQFGLRNAQRSGTPTIGGNNATQAAESVEVSQPVSASIYIAAVAAGTTGDVVFAASTTANGAGLSVCRMIDAASITPSATATDNTDTSGVITLSLNIVSGGAAVGAAQWSNAGTNTWAGLTERIDQDIDASDNFTAADGGSAGTPATITVTNTDTTPSGVAGCAAAWAPLPPVGRTVGRGLTESVLLHSRRLVA